MDKRPLVVFCLLVSGIGCLWTLICSHDARTWGGAENYAMLGLAFIGLPITVLQAIVAALTFFWTRNLRAGMKFGLRASACCLVAANLIAILLAWD